MFYHKQGFWQVVEEKVIDCRIFWEKFAEKSTDFAGILLICLNFAASWPRELSEALHKTENAKYMYNEVAVDECNKNVFSNQRVKSDKKSICSK